MSGTEGIDQNGGALKEAISSEYSKIQLDQSLTDHSLDNDNTKDTIDDTGILSDIDTSMSEKDPHEAANQSALSDMYDNQEGKGKVNKSTNESEDSVAKIDHEEASNQSRELKSLLALSKEAKLDTNISRKRKVLNLRKKVKPDNRFSPGGKSSKIQYPVTAESELEMELSSVDGSNKSETREDESLSIVSSVKSIKRKKSIFLEASGDNVAEENMKKTRKSFSSETAMYKPNKDMFCWRCHKDSVNISCETCPRSYHQRCLKQTITDADHWPCPECVSILKAESTQSRSPAMRGMTLEHLCSLLKFAVNRMIQCQGSEPFIHAVNDSDFPEYKKYIIQPMDLTLLEKNIKENLYGSTQAFEADAKWILHNSIVFNSYQSKLTSVAKFIIKICKQEMSEIENCPSCYLNANTKKKTWFVEVCPKPHLLVWAKLRGFPFWPGKAMSCKDGMVDVRFFGAHDRAWVPEKECFLYSPKDPNLFRVKRADIEQCVEELEVHVENLKKIYIEFSYPTFKTPLDPENEIKQLQIFLPKYKSYFNKHKTSKIQSCEKTKTGVKDNQVTEETKHHKSKESPKDMEESREINRKESRKCKSLNSTEDENMEGYGTDDESMPEIDTELRKTLLKQPEKNVDHDNNEADEDDTQMPATIEADSRSGFEEIILNRSTVKKVADNGKPGSKTSDSEPSSKRPSLDDSSAHSSKSIRRNSESKTESTKISDKISRVSISEEMEISIGNDKGTGSCVEHISSSNSECSSDSVEIKKKPVQVDVDNVEFTISPASKLKIADKLMKRLSDGETSEENSTNNLDQIKQTKRNLNNEESDNTQEPQLALDPEIPDVNPGSSAHDTQELLPETSKVTEVIAEVLDNQMEDISEPTDPKENPEVADVGLNKVPEVTEAISEQEDELADTSSTTTYPNQIMHQELDITDTKTEEEEPSDTNSDVAEGHANNKIEEPIKLNSDVVNTTINNTSKETNDVDSMMKDATLKSSRPKIVIKAKRTEDKLDQLMKINFNSISRRKSEEEQQIATTNIEKNQEKIQTEQSVGEKEVSIVQSSKVDEINDSHQGKTVICKTPSPEKVAKQIAIDHTEEKRDSISQGKEISSKESIEDVIVNTELAKAAETDLGEKEVAKVPKKIKMALEVSDSQKENQTDKEGNTDEAMDTTEGVGLNINKVNIINIIHSSLKDTTTSPNKSAEQDNDDGTEDSASKSKIERRKSSKRKKSIDFDESALETQNKVLKLVSIESIMNKANNNQDENREKEETSLLKSTLQQPKKVAKSTSIQSSSSSSNRNSIHEISPDDIKSEPESEAESSNIRDLEAKKKYLSALNILEKGEADAQKPKSNEIRTRSKTEEKRERFRVSNEPQIVDNMTKIIEDVAVNYSAVHDGDTLPRTKINTTVLSTAKPDGGEIFVKSFAKIVPDTPESNITTMPSVPSIKQRARKSFPQPTYSILKPGPQPIVVREPPRVSTSTPIVLPPIDAIPRLVPRTPIATSSPISTVVPTVTPTQTQRAVPPLQQLEAMRPTNGYLILQPPQQDNNVVILPPNQTINYSTAITSQVVSVTPCLVSAPTSNTPTMRFLTQPPQVWHPGQNHLDRESLNLSESQNYIPQGEPAKNIPSLNNDLWSTASSGNKKLVNGLPEPALISSTVETSSNATSATSAIPSIVDRPLETPIATVPEPSQPVEAAVIAENGDDEELGVLNSIIPENVSRAVSEILRRPPPKLKPRPPGILSQQFSEGIPSTAGPVTSRINSVAHRLGDYFRGMLIETLEDLGKTANSEAAIANLKMEMESLKHRHNIEISEIEKNMCTVLKDVQRSILDDRERVIEETRAACEAEAIKRVEEAKSKQWCASCSKEAQFYCCWNTSYCNYPCQQKHWPTHMSKCTQNVNQPAQITATAGIRPTSQQLILRPANPPPKGGIGRVFTKPVQKVYMNRNVAAPKTMRVQTSAGNVLTMMETTPGNYQLVTTNALVRTGPPITTIKSTSLISVPSPGIASISTTPQQKTGTPKSCVRVLSHSIPVTTVLEEDSD